MSRLWSLLKRFLWFGGAVALLWIVIAKPVDQGQLAGSEFQRASLEAVAAALGPVPSGASEELLAGAAKVEIAPPLEWNVPLGGNRRFRFARAEGKRAESVWARALALAQGERVFVLVSADIMVVHTELGEAILERIRREVPIDRHQLMLVAAHTHSGPGGYWQGTLAEMSIGPYQQRMFDFLVDRLSRSAIEAWRRRRPVHASVGTIAVELPIQNRVVPGGIENADLGVLRFEAIGDGSVIDLFNYSAHPTTLLRGNRLLTGDYPALVAQMAEERAGDSILVFTPGSIGDQKPWFKRERDHDIKSRSIAEILYTEGLQAVELEPLTTPVLEAFEFEVRMPPLQPRLLRSDRLGSWAARRWLADLVLPDSLDRAVVQVVRLGRTALIGAPSDLSTSVVEPLLARARRLGLEVFFVSMAEEWIGYVMTREEYERSEYKETTQFHGPLSGPLFVEIYGRLIDELAKRLESGPISEDGS